MIIPPKNMVIDYKQLPELSWCLRNFGQWLLGNVVKNRFQSIRETHKFDSWTGICGAKIVNVQLRH